MNNRGKISDTDRSDLKRRKRNAKSVAVGKIEKLRADIERLTGVLYGLDNKDALVRLMNYKTYKVEIIRGFILYLQLSIESLLKELLVYRLKGETRIFKVRQIKKTVEDMRSRDILGWCGHLNLVTETQHARIVELNRIRNLCAHNWVLDLPRYRKDRRGKSVKIGVVRFNDKNILNETVFRDEFMPVYSGIYLKLLGKAWRNRRYI